VPERKDILATKVFTESFSLVLPLKHPLAKRKKINLLDLANEPFIGLPYDCAPKVSEAIVEICRKSGFVPRVVQKPVR